MAAAMVVASICVVGLFIVLTVIMSQKITKPLRRLALSARNIGKGMELEELAGENHKDEIGVLCRVVYNSNKQLNVYMNEIKTRAYRDALTGLKNRAAYNEAQKDIERRIADGETEFGALVLDVNNMKAVNDTYGHVYGNMLLTRVAKLVTASFHRSAVYRIGGDEFVVVLEGDDYDDREALLARFDKMCAEECLEMEDNEIPISIARGLAIYDSQLDSSYENVFHRADGAMYRHKRERKGL
jgi:diguanylate cyclase (GGDEF)-like protein